MSYNLNKETSIGFLKEVIRHLEQKILDLESKVSNLTKELNTEEETKKKLMEELSILRQKYFDRLSEKGKGEKGRKKKGENLLHNKNPLGDLDIEVEELEEVSKVHELIDKICQYCNSNKLKQMKGAYEESKEVEIIENRTSATS